MRRRFIFDIDQARKIVSDGREPVELDQDDIRFAVDSCRVNRNHVPHVDSTIPGIISHVFYPQDGQIVQGHVFIDGHHRAARALELNQPFFVHVLTENESRQILIRSPEPNEAAAANGHDSRSRPGNHLEDCQKFLWPRRLEINDFPHRRLHDLTIRAIADGAEYIVKNPRTRKYLKVGPVEAYLLERLDGQSSAGEICGSFEKKFGEPLSPADLDAFVDVARSQGLLESSTKTTTEPARAAPTWWGSVLAGWRKLRKQNPLFIRVSLCDPDRFLNWLEPRTRFLWSPTFVKFAVVGMAAAFVIVLVNQQELISLFTTGLRWQTLTIAWLTVIAATVCHEFGHGLACKRHGGEVHEIGVLMMFFMPFLFCNVSDAWLLPSKRQRLLISFAGVYIDLLIWVVAVFTWRLTVQDTLVNYLAWIAPDCLRRPLVFQSQSAAEARRLLLAQRLAGNSQLAAAGAGSFDGSFPLATMGCSPSGED